jgi:hypothetical protein
VSLRVHDIDALKRGDLPLDESQRLVHGAIVVPDHAPRYRRNVSVSSLGRYDRPIPRLLCASRSSHLQRSARYWTAEQDQLGRLAR